MTDFARTAPPSPGSPPADAPEADAPRPHAVDDPGSEDHEGLRARKKKLTRRAIHEAALHLVSERGLDHVTAEEIAATAGVSARTFFNYFPTKDAAVLGLPPDLADLLGEALLARPAEEDLFTALTGIVRGWLSRMDEDPLRDLRRAVVGRDPRLGAAMIGANREVEAALVRAAGDRERSRAGEVAPVSNATDLHIRIMVAAVTAAGRATYVHAQQCGREDEDPATQSRRFARALTDAFTMLAEGLATLDRNGTTPAGA